MKTNIYLILFFCTLLALGQNGYAQERKNSKNETEQRNFYRKLLQVDSLKGDKVMEIHAGYKKALATVMADTSLNEAAKRIRINQLIEDKNKRLRLFLSPGQQLKIIPTTEREVAAVKEQH